MNAEELNKLDEEFKFWEQNYFNICIYKRVPEQIPDIEAVKNLLNEFREEFDYYSIMRRRAIVKRLRTQIVH